jgi:phytanoyl-CoA hydroxylase
MTSILTISPCSYLLVPQFLSLEETNALLTRSKQLLDEFSLDDHPLTKFTTSDRDHIGDDYFLTSGDKIRYFLEEDAVDENGKLTREKQKAVNKIGHGKHIAPGSPDANGHRICLPQYTALHELDPVFRKVTLENDRLRALVRDLKFHKDPVGMSFNYRIFYSRT